MSARESEISTLCNRIITSVSGIGGYLYKNLHFSDGWVVKNPQLDTSGHGGAELDVQTRNSGRGGTKLNVQTRNSGRGGAELNVQTRSSGRGGAELNVQTRGSGHGGTELNALSCSWGLFAAWVRTARTLSVRHTSPRRRTRRRSMRPHRRCSS